MDNRIYLFTVFMLGFVLVGCRFFNKKEAANEDEILLKAPPYNILTDSIRLLPDNADLYKERGVLLSQNGKHTIAYKDYKKLYELQPTSENAKVFIANLFIINNVEEATALLKTCIEKYPDDIDFRRRLSEAYIEEGKRAEALALYDDIIKKDSNDFETWYEKGLLLAQLKDTTQAIEALEKSFNIQPLQMSGVALANLYAETKNKKTIALCDALVRADATGDHKDITYLKAVYYSNINDYASAIKEYDNCIKQDWKFTEAYIEKGVLYYEQGNYKEALRIFQMASTVTNTDPDAYYWQARCHEMLGDKEQAILNYNRAVGLDPSFSEARAAAKRLERSKK